MPPQPDITAVIRYAEACASTMDRYTLATHLLSLGIDQDVVKHVLDVYTPPVRSIHDGTSGEESRPLLLQTALFLVSTVVLCGQLALAVYAWFAGGYALVHVPLNLHAERLAVMQQGVIRMLVVALLPVPVFVGIWQNWRERTLLVAAIPMLLLFAYYLLRFPNLPFL